MSFLVESGPMSFNQVKNILLSEGYHHTQERSIPGLYYPFASGEIFSLFVSHSKTWDQFP